MLPQAASSQGLCILVKDASKSKEGADSGVAIQPRLHARALSRTPGDNLPVNNWWQLLVTKRK